MLDQYAAVIFGHPFFRSSNPALEPLLRERAHFRSYAPGEVICSKTDFSPQLGLVLSGEAVVYQDDVLLNRVQTGGCFGAAALFCAAQEYPTVIRAGSTCDVMLCDRVLLCDILALDRSLMERYLAFLSERILFLNQKIETFTRPDAAAKLLSFLQQNAVLQPDGTARLSCRSFSALAHALDLGRASLYRALDTLEAQQLIKRENKAVILLEQKGKTS